MVTALLAPLVFVKRVVQKRVEGFVSKIYLN